MRRRMIRASFQFTEEQMAWLQARAERLGFANNSEALRDAVRTLMEIEAREAAERQRMPDVPALGADGPAMSGGK
jgi:Arc/MetJ-type ribon-helix-helix transcriptional regulator